MKVMFVSDIHGHDEQFKKCLDFFKQEELDKMIILGDNFSSPYDLSVGDHNICNMLWGIADKLVMVMGNCDSTASEDFIPTNFLSHYDFMLGNKHLMCFHGNSSSPLHIDADIYVSGHTHVSGIRHHKDKIYLNPGSVGRPRDFSGGSFAVVGEHSITIFDLDYNVISEEQI